MTSHRIGLAPFSIALALGSGGCSLLFAPGNWSGGSDIDAAVDEGVDPDAFVPEGVDAALDAAVADPDAVVPRTCMTSAGCELGEYCDPGTMTCQSCDGDGDGVRRLECAGDMFAFYDCDPDAAPPIVSLALTDDYRDSLHVFTIDGETFALYRDGSTSRIFHAGVDTMAQALTHGGEALEQFDAVRSSSQVVIAGYGPTFVGRIELTSGGAVPGMRVPFSSISALMGNRPFGPATLLRASATETYLGFQSGGDSTPATGRFVYGIESGHQAIVHPSNGTPDDQISASANGVAVIPGPGTTGTRRSFYLWGGDIRPHDSGNVGLLETPGDPLTAEMGQVAIAAGEARDTRRLVIMGHGGLAPGEFTAYLADCPAGADAPCTLVGSHTYAVAGALPVLAMHGAPASSSLAVTFAARPDAFLVALLETRPEGGSGIAALPDALIPMIDMPVEPAMSSRALAMDLTADLTATPPRITLTLARAAPRRLQMVSIEVCASFPMMMM